MLDGNDGDKNGGRHPCLQNPGGIFHVTQAEGNRHNSGNGRCHQKPQTGGNYDITVAIILCPREIQSVICAGMDSQLLGENQALSQGSGLKS